MHSTLNGGWKQADMSNMRDRTTPKPPQAGNEYNTHAHIDFCSFHVQKGQKPEKMQEKGEREMPQNKLSENALLSYFLKT